MAVQTRRMLGLAFLGAFFVVGVPYWTVAYGRANLPDAVLNGGLVVVGALAALSRILSPARLLLTTVVVGSSVPAAVMARVVYDGIQDPTSHNLWPFEIALSGGPGLAAAFAGALVGGIFASLGRLRAGADDRNRV